ncbi:MAG: creatininase family protein [Candidatus Poribacteria bacterium]|nr:creatininase family protein [Candidatus Poribacteria bacterium]
MAKVRYEEMLPSEIIKARNACPIAYVPLGTLEWHGEHNAVGLDALKAHALAVKCAETGGGLAFPALWYGENRESNLMEVTARDSQEIARRYSLPPENFAPGYTGVSPHEQDIRYVELLLNICRQVRSLGFKVVVLMAGHYPLLRHAKAVEELMMLRDRDVRVVAVTGYELVREDIPDAGDHAGKWETSLLMVLRPECVDMSKLPADANEPLIGVSNDARRANEDYGRQGVELVVQRIVEKAEAALSG